VCGAKTDVPSVSRFGVRLSREPIRNHVFGCGCTLAPTGEYAGAICMASAMRDVATITLSTAYIRRKIFLTIFALRMICSSSDSFLRLCTCLGV